jgi:predicted nucleotidyltransferase
VEPRAFVARLAGDIAEALRGNLVGVYLHGSLALGCFNPARSDVDVLVVVERPLGPRRRSELARALLGASGRPFPVELTVQARSDLHPWRHPAPFDFHFAESLRARIDEQASEGSIARADRHDTDLAGHIGLLLERGETLVGAPAIEVFPPIPEADFLDSILADLEWIRRPETRMGGRIYGVLNACRVLAYVRGAGILSKAEAAEWTLEALQADLRPTVASALRAYRSGADEPLPPEEARRFVASVWKLIESEVDGEGSSRRSPVGGEERERSPG